MRIGIHAHLLFSGQSYRNAGISQYIRHLLTAMQGMAGEHELLAFVNSGFTEFAAFPHTRIVRSNTPGESSLRRILFEQMVLPRLCRRLGIDVLHGAGFALPLLSPIAGVVTIHDVSFLRFTDSHLGPNRRYLAAISKASVKRARRVIAVSKATAEDTVSLLGAPQDRVRVVYEGVDSFYHPPSEENVAAFRARQGLDDPFLLFVGTLEPRKNLWSLLQAYQHARRMGLTQTLVVVGGRGWKYEEMLKTAHEGGLDAGVHFAGYAPVEDMPLWYGAADVFVYPSLLEGFGLPVLEAMACGAPVITSDVSSLPEVGGGAAAYVSPRNVDDIEQRLLEVAGDADRRRAMRALGLAQAATFQWETAARETMRVYEEAVR